MNNAKQSLCTLDMFWLGTRYRGPNLWGTVCIYLVLLLDFRHFFPVRQKPINEISALPPAVQTEEFPPCQAGRAKATQIKWVSANAAVVTGGLCVSTRIWGELATWDWVSWDFFSRFTFWHILKYESKRWTNWFKLNPSMEHQPDLSPCGGWPLPSGFLKCLSNPLPQSLG